MPKFCHVEPPGTLWVQHLLRIAGSGEILGPKGTPGCGLAQDDKTVELFQPQCTSITAQSAHTVEEDRFVMLSRSEASLVLDARRPFAAAQGDSIAVFVANFAL